MQLNVRCDCGADLRLRSDNAERRARCPRCKRALRVPPVGFFEQHDGEALALPDLPIASLDTRQVRAASDQETMFLKERTVAQVRREALGDTGSEADEAGPVPDPAHPGYAPTIAMPPSPVAPSTEAGPTETDPAYAATIPFVPSPVAQHRSAGPSSGPPGSPAEIPSLPDLAPVSGSFPVPPAGDGGKGTAPVEEWKEGDVIDSKCRIFGSARGAMGRVYFVDHLQWQMRLAIKTVLPQGGRISERRLKRFRGETEAWINLGKHPNLVTAFYLRQIEGRLCLFLEYVDGRGLEQLVQQTEPTPIPEILDIAIQVCDGVSHAHARGMIHRDLKPSNVLLSKDGLAKVTDFGLVKVEDAEGPSPGGEEPQSAVGTPAYMAPEQFLASHAVDARADIYSFGLVIHMLLGQDYVFAPTEKLSKLEMFQFLRHAHQVVPPAAPKDRRPDTPDALNALVLRCLAKSPDDRYPDFLSVRADLLQVYQSLTGQPYPREEILVPELNSADLNNRALTFFDLDQEDRALEFLEEAHAVDPGSPMVCANLATVWGRVQKRDPALSACFEAARSAGNKIPDLSIRLAGAAREFLRLEEADQFAGEARQKEPGSAGILNLMAAIAHTRGHLDLATKRLNEALAASPEDVDLLHNLAVCQFESGDLGGAAGTLRRGCELAPEDAELAADLAVVLAEGGRQAEAINWCVHALRLDPEGFWTALVGAEILGGQIGTVEATRPDIARSLYGKLHQRYPLQWKLRLRLADGPQGAGRAAPELLPQPLLAEAAIDDRRWARPVRVGRPSPLALRMVLTGQTRFREAGQAVEPAEGPGPAEEVQQRLAALAPGSTCLPCSPNRLWAVAAEGNCVRLYARDSLDVLRTVSMDEAVPIPGPAGEVGGQGAAGTPARAVWSLDSRFLRLHFPDGSRRLLEFSTAADGWLSPFRVSSPPLMLDRSSSASETIELLRQRAELLRKAQAAEERWDHSEAFKLYRNVQRLRGFERDFDAHAGATRAANWLTAPTGLRTGWERKRFPLQGHESAIRKIEILGGGKRGLILSDDGRLRFSNLIVGHVLWALDAEFGWIEDVASSAEANASLLLCSDRVLRYLNLNSQVVHPVVQLRTRQIARLCPSEDSRTFYCFNRGGDLEHWTIDPELSVETVLHLEPRWQTVLFASNRKSFLALGPGQGALLGDCSKREITQEMRFQRADEDQMVVCLSPSAEKALITGEDPSKLEVWDCRSGRCVSTVGRGTQPITALAIDSKGRHAVAGSGDGLIRLWELASGACLRTFSGHSATVTALTFSPNDEFFLSGDASGNLKFWALDWAWEFES